MTVIHWDSWRTFAQNLRSQRGELSESIIEEKDLSGEMILQRSWQKLFTFLRKGKQRERKS
jgi:hypothetical protein